MKYAVHNASIGLSLKLNDNRNSFKTQPNSTKKDVIRNLYGPEIAKELLQIDFADENLQFKLSGLITKPTFSVKKLQLLIFINSRLVKSKAIKQMFEEVYASYVPRGQHPFVYLSLEITPQNIDVNCCPTKSEVKFLHEETIIKRIYEYINDSLKSHSHAKNLTQTILPGASPGSQLPLNKSRREERYPQDVTRVDSSIQKIDKFLKLSEVIDDSLLMSQSQQRPKTFMERFRSMNQSPPIPKQSDKLLQLTQAEEESEKAQSEKCYNIEKRPRSIAESIDESPIRSAKEGRRSLCYNVEKRPEKMFEDIITVPVMNQLIKLKEQLDTGLNPEAMDEEVNHKVYQNCNLTSIVDLQKEIMKKCCFKWREIVADLTFVGAYDKDLVFVQQATELYMCKTKILW